MNHLKTYSGENFMALSFFELSPAGDATVFGGENEQGKTAASKLLLEILLRGKTASPPKPVKEGGKKAVVKGVIETEQADIFNGEISITRTVTEDGNWTVKVVNKDGLSIDKPQTILDRLFPNALVDPGEFVRGDSPSDDRRRAAVLAKITGVDLSGLDAKRTVAFDARTIINREVSRLDAVVKSLPLYWDAPAEEMPLVAPAKAIDEVKPVLVSVAALNAKLDDARKTNAINDARRADLFNNEKKILSQKAEIERLEELVSMAYGLLSGLKEENAAMTAAVNNLFDADESAIRAKLAAVEAGNAAAQAEADEKNRIAREAAAAEARAYTERAQATNEKVRANVAHAKAVAELEKAKAESAAKTAEIEAVEAEKTRLLSAVKLPVNGLTFDSQGVYYNGRPCHEKQLSSEEGIRIGFALALAQNPSLDVMVIQNGALLDDKRLALFVSMARSAGIHLLVEDVGDRRATIVIEGGKATKK
jgi:hypothetical protein